MHKTILHIYSLVKKLLLLTSLVFFNCTSFAQDDVRDSLNYDATTTDTAYTVETESEALPKFDSLAAYDMPSYHAYTLPDSVLEKLKQDDAFWYANKVPKRQKPQEIKPPDYKAPFYTEGWFKTLIWIIIIGGFVTVLVWFLIASDVKLFRKKPTQLSNDADIQFDEDIFSINYEEELQRAIAHNDYRLGVRLMYLHVLKLLSDKEIIQYKIEKTNSDYLLQLYNTSYYKDFFRLTRNFEYVWYGKFEISPAAFEMIGNDYKKLKALL